MTDNLTMQNTRDLIAYYMNNILGDDYNMPQTYLCLILMINFIIHVTSWKRGLDNRTEISEILQTIEKLETKIQNLEVKG